MGWLERASRTVARLWGGGRANALVRARGSVEQLALEEKSIRPGDLIPLNWVGKARWSTFDTAEAIDTTYREVAWVYICATKNAMALSQIPWVAQGKLTDDTWEDLPGSDLTKILEHPNDIWSRQRFIQLVVLELLLAGNSIVCKLRDTEGRITELFTVRPQRIAPILSRTEFISGYVVKTADNKTVKIAAEDVVHLQLPDPGNRFWGLSPLQAAMKATDTESDAADWQKYSLQNMMIPPGILRVQSNIGVDQEDNILDDLSKKYQRALNARRPMVFGGMEAEWTQLSLTPQELDFLQTRRLTREEICAVYGVPPPMVGILDHSTYNNISTAKEIWWEDTLIPLLSLVAEAWNLGLAPEYGENLRVRPDTSKVVPLLAGNERRIGLVEKLFAMGVPFNSASEFVSLGLQIDGGDIGYLPANLIPVTSVEVQPEEVKAMPRPAEPDEKEVARFRRNVLGKTNGKTSAQRIEEYQRVLRCSIDEALSSLKH